MDFDFNVWTSILIIRLGILKMIFLSSMGKHRFPVGGVYSKIWAPFRSRAPPKNFSGKQKFFKGGGEVDVIFSKTKVPEIFRKTTSFQKFPKFPKFFIFKKIYNSSMPGPPPRTLGPPFLLLGGGGVTPPHSPPGGTEDTTCPGPQHLRYLFQVVQT